MTDRELKEFFRQNRPEVGDQASFLAGVSARMEAMAEVKRAHDAEQRHYRVLLIAVFCTGILVGGAVIVLASLHPVQLDSGVLDKAMAYLAKWKYAICAAISLGAVFGSLLLPDRSSK